MPHTSIPPNHGDGDVLVRVRVRDRNWAASLPAVPAGEPLTVSVGDPTLLPTPADDLVAGGYRIVGVASERASIGRSVDVLVPAALRHSYPGWWQRFAPLAERVFDLRLGPVRRILAGQLALHDHKLGA